MTEDEIEQLIVAIEGLLGDLNLDVVVAQERVLATEGEIKSGDDLGDRGDTISAVDSKRADRPYRAGVTEDTLLDQVLPPYEVAARPGRNVRKRFRFTNDDVRVTPLDAHSRLRNLLDLVEVATAGTLAMERVVHDEIASLANGGIMFVDLPESELRGMNQEPWTLAIDSEFQTAATHAENVVALLDSLRALAGVERGQELAGRVDDGVEDIWVLKQERP